MNYSWEVGYHAQTYWKCQSYNLWDTLRVEGTVNKFDCWVVGLVVVRAIRMWTFLRMQSMSIDDYFTFYTEFMYSKIDTLADKQKGNWRICAQDTIWQTEDNSDIAVIFLNIEIANIARTSKSAENSRKTSDSRNGNNSSSSQKKEKNHLTNWSGGTYCAIWAHCTALSIHYTVGDCLTNYGHGSHNNLIYGKLSSHSFIWWEST